MGYALLACPGTRDLSLQALPPQPLEPPRRCSETWGRGTESLDHQEAMLSASCKNQRFTLPSHTRHALPLGLGGQVPASGQAPPHSRAPPELPPLGLAAAHTPSWTGGLIPPTTGEIKAELGLAGSVKLPQQSGGGQPGCCVEKEPEQGSERQGKVVG